MDEKLSRRLGGEGAEGGPPAELGGAGGEPPAELDEGGELAPYSPLPVEPPSRRLNPLVGIAAILVAVALFFSTQLFTAFGESTPDVALLVTLGVTYAAVVAVCIALTKLAIEGATWRNLAPLIVVGILAWPVVTAMVVALDISTAGWTFAVSVAALGFALAFVYLLVKSDFRARDSLRLNLKPRWLLASLGVWLLVLVCNYIYVIIVAALDIDFLQAEFYTESGLEASGEVVRRVAETAADQVLFGLAICLLVPVSEELTFRYISLGFMRAMVAARFVFTAAAVLVSSLIFTGVHVVPYVLIPIFLLSLGISYVYIRYGIYYAIAMHVTQNTLSFSLILLERNGVINF